MGKERLAIDHYSKMFLFIFICSQKVIYLYCSRPINSFENWISCCCCSVSKSCPTLYNPMDYSTPGFPVLQHSQTLQNLMSIELVMPSNHLILCHSLLFLPSVFPIIRGFSSESALFIRWSKYWSFSFSINPSNEYSGLISSRIDWFDLLAV